MAAVIKRGIEHLGGDGRSSSNEVYDPSNRNNRRGLQSPFVLYLTITVSLNAVAILGGVVSEFDLHRNNYYHFDQCDAWLTANGIFGALHIGIAMYLVHKIRSPVREHPLVAGNDGVYVTGYRLHNPHHQKNRQDLEANGMVTTESMAGPPDSFKRVRYVLCESKVFAAYIFVFIAYLCWHFFLEMRACNLGMAFAMRCADVFIWAAPFSFFFSVATMMHQQGRL